jgi:hypothetical protein
LPLECGLKIGFTDRFSPGLSKTFPEFGTHIALEVADGIARGFGYLFIHLQGTREILRQFVIRWE